MKYVRIIVVILVLIMFAWLNWWVLPNLAIVHFAKINEPLQENGYLLAYHNHFKLAGFRLIDFLERGWSGVFAAWPYVMVGILLGFESGFFAGEQARRLMAIDEASKAALDEAAKQVNEAQLMSHIAQRELTKVIKRENGVASSMDYVQKLQAEDRGKRKEFEELKANWEEKQRHAESTVIELKKARNKIRRLEEKISRMEENMIDEP